MKQGTLRDYIASYGYTVEEWNKTVDELCKNGVGKGRYQDYNLLMLVIGWLTNFDSKINEET